MHHITDRDGPTKRRQISEVEPWNLILLRRRFFAGVGSSQPRQKIYRDTSVTPNVAPKALPVGKSCSLNTAPMRQVHRVWITYSCLRTKYFTARNYERQRFSMNCHMHPVTAAD